MTKREIIGTPAKEIGELQTVKETFEDGTSMTYKEELIDNSKWYDAVTKAETKKEL